MKSRWSEEEAARAVARYGPRWGEDLALRVYASRLLGAEPGLVLHGGGNTSVKSVLTDILGRPQPVLWVKGSGFDMNAIEPEGHAALDLDALRALRDLADLGDEEMLSELRIRRLRDPAPDPSIETLAHAFLPGKFIDHTHPDAILALTNQKDGERLVREALGEDVIVLDYVRPGFRLAKAAAEAIERAPDARTIGEAPSTRATHKAPASGAREVAVGARSVGRAPHAGAMVWMRHGLLTWADAAGASYEATIEIVSRAEEFLAGRARTIAATRAPSRNEGTPAESPQAGDARSLGRSPADGPGPSSATLAYDAGSGSSHSSAGVSTTSLDEARERLLLSAPVLRGLLAHGGDAADAGRRPTIVRPLDTPEILEILDRPGAAALALTPPLTSDHLIRTKPLPMWIADPPLGDEAALREAISHALARYRQVYEEYVGRHASRMPIGQGAFDPLPRVVLMPGLGALCAGPDARAAGIVRDIAERTLRVKALVAAGGGEYEGLSEEHLFDMEYHALQRRKLGTAKPPALEGRTALVTGAAGAIGSGIVRALLEEGCHVAATDLPGGRLDALGAELSAEFGERLASPPLDVTDPSSVACGFESVAAAWGGLDLLVINAGAAHVSSLARMDLEEFRRLEAVNLEGTLLLLREAAKWFERQGCGGDVVLISTKNVFAPGASFGAYSATKAAAHQLARVASLELAPLGVRVNMVAPDAVFSEGERRSGLWAEVGPERMRARGLDEKGLEEYYRNRNLLKARVAARDVARAVLFFATRQTPTTGATFAIGAMHSALAVGTIVLGLAGTAAAAASTPVTSPGAASAASPVCAAPAEVDPAATVEFVWAGALSPTSIRVNAKLSGDSATVRLRVSPNADLSGARLYAYDTASASLNHRVVSILMKGLTPGTPYFYVIESDGVVDARDRRCGP